MMDRSQTWETTDVVVCGCGPTGAMLSALLGQSSVANVVLERDRQVATDPRGIALDEDGIRMLQGLGIYDKVFSEIGSCNGALNFVSGRHHDLSVKPFLRIDMTTSEGGTGHVGLVFHKQPVMEKYMRLAASKTNCSNIRLGCSLASISEDEDWVYVTYHDEVVGKTKSLRCKFLVGADGKTGYVRKNYLEPRGIVLERASATPYEEIWVAINVKFTIPTPETHPEFPLWALGYSPEEAYNAFVPQEFRFLCNPDRPSICGRFGPPSDMLWRFEYVILEGETGEEMARMDKVKEIVWPYLTHPGRRYGLSEDVSFPEDCADILRSSRFTFSARSANKWSLNRVILVGDACHVFPPFGGQGIVSGFRDVSALSWRLSIACRTGFNNYEDLLSGWSMERKQQLERSLATTVANGEAVTERNWLKATLRDWYLWGVQLVPSWRRYYEMGPRVEGMIRYKYVPGMAFLPNPRGGFLFPQVYCTRINDEISEASEVRFTDDIIFDHTKICLFQVVVVLDKFSDYAAATDALSNLDRLSGHELSAAEATYIVHSTSVTDTQFISPESSAQDMYRLATADEFARSYLCKNRPIPKYYDAYRILKETNGKKFLILRPDRFVFAACADKWELEKAARGISRLVNGLSLQEPETDTVRAMM